ncbi:targeting protein for Xklp2 [Epargyreus clarus]|uniref:targeting protein for Xklp2 n=1 Tax=Epargyreus clarus TaxID=520877 RepID=UPI003C2ED0A9
MARNHVTNFRGELHFTPSGKLHIKDEPITPIDDDFGDHNKLDSSFQNEYGSMRKSLSMNDIAAIKEEFLNLQLHDDQQDIYQRYRKPVEATHELSRTKFVSMAEAIYHYQRDTPGRFHSTRPKTFRSNGATGPSGLTVPQSPMLRCKARARPHHILSQKEKEEMELEEIRKFKIKANPIPKSVIEGSKNLPEVHRKPITVPEPFKLTEVHKKAAQSPGQVQQFKARPAPKHILEKPQIPIKPPVQVTKPQTPKFHYKRANSADHLKESNRNEVANKHAHNHTQKNAEKTMQRHGPVKPEPFSFEKRDEELKKRREERIKQQIEEERRLASQFKAHPLPGAVKKQMRCATAKSSASNTSSENKENHVKFEARPPNVLYKEPFKPVYQPFHIIKPKPFDLTTEKRAAEREEFERLLREKEEQNEKLRKEKEQEQLEAEERAKAELRAKLIHHAKPVPVMVPFVPERSVAPLTVPETPKFVRRLRQN